MADTPGGFLGRLRGLVQGVSRSGRRAGPDSRGPSSSGFVVCSDRTHRLPVVAEQFDVPEHPNLQRAIDSYCPPGTDQHEILGVSIDPVWTVQPGRPSSVNAATRGHSQAGRIRERRDSTDEVLPCIQNGLYLVTGPEEALGCLREGAERDGIPREGPYRGDGSRREAAESFLADLRRRMREGNVYRGRVLSLFLDSMRTLHVSFHCLGGVDRRRSSCPKDCSSASSGRRSGSPRTVNGLRALGPAPEDAACCSTGRRAPARPWSPGTSSTPCRGARCSC